MKIATLACLCAVAAFASSARADVPVAATTLFPRGTFSLTLEADYAHSFDLSRARIESGAIGIGYYLFDNISISAEAAGFAIQQSGPDSALSEFDLRIRQHILNAGKFSLFFEFSAGVSYADARTPGAGTYYNYVLQPGAGVSWQLKDRLFLVGGARYWHLSNARLDGPGRNPSINAIEGYAGLMFLL